MESRVETLLNAIIDGETIDFNPQSRMEEYLKNCINKAGVEGLPAPQSRVDALLYKLAETISSGGGGGGSAAPTGPTDNRTNLSYWYQYLGEMFGEYYDWEVSEEPYLDREPLEYVEFPSGTQNVTNFRYFAKVYLYNDADQFCSGDRGLPTKSFVGTLDVSSAASLTDVFNSLEYLETIGDIVNTHNVKNFTRMFSGCSALKRVPPIDTRAGENFYCMFNYCLALTDVDGIDLRNATNVTLMFSDNNELTNITIKNIAISLQVGSDTSWTSWGQLLTVESLIGLIRELRDTGSTKTFTVGSKNLEKLANVYVRTVDITNEMRSEDDLIDEKLPFEVCGSADEGAILITDYALFKNWEIK